MKKLIILSLAILLTSCASKWKAKSSNPATAENTLKTDWGYIKVDYDKITDEGIFFNIELKNDSKAPIKYERGYIFLKSDKGDKYQDLQNKYLGQNISGTAKFANSGNKAGAAITAIKSLWQGAQVLGNGDIAPGSLHTDRLIYGKKSTKGKNVTLIFGPELVKNSTKNTISFVSE